MISKWDVVAGDVIKLEAGSIVPADCLLISSNLLVVESQSKSEHGDPFLYSDQLVTSGKATALVACVGIYTQRNYDQHGNQG